MPVYGFSCDTCGVAFDLSRPIDQAGLPAVCPICGSGSTSRHYAAIVVVRSPGVVVAPISRADRPGRAAHAHGCPCCRPARHVRTEQEAAR